MKRKALAYGLFFGILVWAGLNLAATAISVTNAASVGRGF